MVMALDINQLKKTYTARRGFLWRRKDVVPALKGISFHIRKGEIFGLLGPNGAGKTTTVNILSGLVLKDDGIISFFGEELSDASRERMNATTAYQSLMGHLTVYQNLKVFAKIYHVKNVEQRIDELLKKFRLERLKRTPFYVLSSGEKTRVTLCKGLINHPELLLLDEATVGLDPDIAEQVREEVKQLDTTILLTSHNMYEVEELCDRIAFLHEGRILKMGTPDELTRLIKEQKVVIDFAPGQRGFVDVLEKLGVHVVEHSGLRVVLQIPRAEKQLHNILHPLFKGGFAVRDLSIEKPSLEQAFIRMARGEV